MKKVIAIGLLALIVLTFFTGSVVAGGGDEHYNGEDGEQPAPGAEDSLGPGEPSTAPDTGDRSRFKDY